MQMVASEQMASEGVLERNGFDAGIDGCLAGVCVGGGQDQADGAKEFPSDGRDAIQRCAGLESIDGQLGQIHVSAVVIGRDGGRGYHKNAAENGHQSYLDANDFSCSHVYV